MLAWLQALLGNTPAVTVILWVVGILVVLGGFLRGLYRAWPFIKQGVITINSLADLPRFMSTTAATLEAQDQGAKERDIQIAEIHHEVHYNNGSSVKDAVARVELGVKGLYERADAADQNAVELREDLEQTKPRSPARKRPPKPKENI